MGVCKFFLQGKCSFGNRCYNEHPQNQPSGFGQSASQSLMQGGGGSTPNNSNRFGALSGGFGTPIAAFGGFANKPSTQAPVAGAAGKSKYVPLDAQTLSKAISEPLLWKLSAFAPKYSKPNLLSGTDISPEEMQLDFRNAARTNELPACEAKYKQLEQDVGARIAEINTNSAEYARQWEAQYGDAQGDTEGLGFGDKPAFGAFAKAAAAASGFGLNSGKNVFGTPSKPSPFGSGNTTNVFGQNTGATAFGTPSKTLGFGTNSTGGLRSGFGTGSAFGAKTGDAVFGSQANNIPKFLESETRPSRNLSDEEIGMFKAASFVFGNVPEQAPTVDLI